MTVATATFAFDNKSARTFDADGRMRVVGCTISVAEVNPYYGKEIPGRERLGLDANTVYDLYRDPAELERAAESFNGLALMIRHIAQTAKEPRKEYIGGSVYNARFDRATGQLKGDLLIFDAEAIEYVESGTLADLSSSYRYEPDMTAGEIDGRKFDGTMRNIEGNHVALVEDGRATGAHVADSALIHQPGAPNVDDPTNPNPAAETGNAEVATALTLLVTKIEGIEARLTKLEGGGEQPPAPAAAGAADEGPDKPDKEDDDKPAMDAAAVKALIDTAVSTGVAAERARSAAVEQAKRDTRADLGDVIAMDNAADIYRAALKQRGVDVAAIPAGTEQAAYQAVNAAVRPAVLANDSRAAGAEAKRVTFDTSRIRHR